MALNNTHLFYDKLSQFFGENEIKLWFIINNDICNNIIIVTKKDQVYEFSGNAINNSLLIFSQNYFITEQKINESLVSELCNIGIIDFKAGLYHKFALTSNRKLYCWGRNECGVLGNGRQDGILYKPHMNEYFKEKPIIEMSCGKEHSLVLTIDGEVYGWGSNKLGQIGNKESFEELTPYFVNKFNGEKVISISCGSVHSLALTESGRVYSWGYNTWGLLGRNTAEEYDNCPKTIELRDINIKRICCGYSHSLLLSREGDIYIFGSNSDRELGTNTESDRQLLPLKLNSKEKFTEIAAHWSQRFSSALSMNGFYIWGDCKEGIMRKPVKSKVSSFNEIFIYYFNITYNSINGENIQFNDDFIRNGFFKKNFIDSKLLEEGGYGKVFRVKCDKIWDKGNYAIKRIDSNCFNVSNEMDSKELQNFSVIKQLNNENVVKYYDLWLEKNMYQNSENPHIFIQMELCDTTLNHIMQEMKNDRKFQNNNSHTLFGHYISNQLFIQILEGVHYLHTRNPQIIHRDLKPDNILIKMNNKDRSVIKIADMGLICLHNNENTSNVSSHHHHTRDPIAHLNYSAPEMLESRNYDTRADVYSLGVVLKELFLINDNRDSTDQSVSNKHQQLSELCDKMTKQDVNQRPRSCLQILKDKHLWALNGIYFNKKEEFRNNCDENYKNSYIYKLLMKLCVTIHPNVRCKKCSALPIIGIRFKCSVCKDHDLCESCIVRGLHSKSHSFREIN